MSRVGLFKGESYMDLDNVKASQEGWGGGEFESCSNKESAIDAAITPAEIHQTPW